MFIIKEMDVPTEDEWTMDFYDFSKIRLNLLRYSLGRLQQRQQLNRGPLAPPPALAQGTPICPLCQREEEILTSHPNLELLSDLEDWRDKRQHEDYPCCMRRFAKLSARYQVNNFLHIPTAHDVTLEVQHQEEEIVTNQRVKALEDHNSYCQNVDARARASDNTGDTVYKSTCDNFNPSSAVNPAWISPKDTRGVPDNASSVCVSPYAPLIPDDPSSVFEISDIVPQNSSDSGYTSPEGSPVHGDSVQLESTLKTHIVFHRGPKIKGSIRKRRCVGSAVSAINLDHIGSNPKSVPSRVLAGRNSPKNRKSQAKDDPALAKKGPKKGKARRAPLSPEEERKKLERNKQKAIKEKQRRDKSKNLLDDVKAFLRHAFPAVLGKKSCHQRVIDTLIKLNPAVEFQEKWAKKNLLRVRRFLRQKKGSC